MRESLWQQKGDGFKGAEDLPFVVVLVIIAMLVFVVIIVAANIYWDLLRANCSVVCSTCIFSFNFIKYDHQEVLMSTSCVPDAAITVLWDVDDAQIYSGDEYWEEKLTAGQGERTRK